MPLAALSPTRRKVVYAISYEVIGLLLSALVLAGLAESQFSTGLTVSVIMAIIALIWNYLFNTAFEAWERRQPRRGRPFALRCLHAGLFELGLTLQTVPVLMWVLDLGPWQALIYDIALTLCYAVYTFVFTWAFDRIFGLPHSAK
jgi:uncharacterized membrane protein